MKEIMESVRAMERKHKKGIRGNSNDFLMNMSHEFKTPLSAIQLNAQLLEKVVENKSGHLLKFLSKYIERILDQSKNVVNILEDTMMFLRMQTEKPHLEFSVVDSNAIYKEVTATFENYYPNRVLDIKDDSSFKVMADRNTMFKAIIRMIRIALEANPQKRPELSMSDSEDYLSIELIAPNLRIKETELAKIFEPFSSLSEFNQIEALPLRLGLIRQLLALNKSKIRIKLREGNIAVLSVCVPKYEYQSIVK